MCSASSCCFYYTFIYMKKALLTNMLLAACAAIAAQGWPADYKGVMLQGFYWDSYSDTKWTALEAQADDLSQYFDLIWVPQSGWTGSTTSMGYNDIYWYDQRSAFGTEAELRSMIQAYRQRGVGIMADVVINHRGGATRWTDFPTETNPLDGIEYSMGLGDICSTDDYNTSSDAASERETYGEATGAADTGDDFSGYRDLDHTGENVQANCKAYTKYLLDYLGYTGFRYDMVKGYGAEYVGMYNAYSNPAYSVGEYWDSNKSNVTAWIKGTETDGAIQSAAFDFPQKYLFNNNTTKYQYWFHTAASLATDDEYKRYSVTFVDNHDSYRDSNKFSGDARAANAFILGIPGTPCVFLQHWKSYKSDIAKMIKVRKMIGISNTSACEEVAGTDAYDIVRTTGSDGTLIVIVGNISSARSKWNPADNGYRQVLLGNQYAYYVNSGFSGSSYVVDKAPGAYDNSVSVTISPIGGTAVYTTDGTTPTSANGTQITSDASLTFSTTTTLTVGSLVDGTVEDVRTYVYEVSQFSPYSINVYVSCPEWSPLYFYAWDDDGTQLLGSWPGTKAANSTTVDGETWYYQTFDITASGYVVNFIFNNGNGNPQTVDITGINTDRWFRLGALSTGQKYDYTDVTSVYAGIQTVTDDAAEASGRSWHSLSGVRYSSKPKAPGIYIHAGRKVVIK